jgi:hypothetical protein
MMNFRLFHTPEPILEASFQLACDTVCSIRPSKRYHYRRIPRPPEAAKIEVLDAAFGLCVNWSADSGV